MEALLTQLGIKFERLDKRDRFEIEKMLGQMKSSGYRHITGAEADLGYGEFVAEQYYIYDKEENSALICRSDKLPSFTGQVQCGDEVSVVALDGSWVMQFHDHCCAMNLVELYQWSE